MPNLALPVSLAQSFHDSHVAYFFEEAHFLVEASASVEATEFAPNKFRFADGSVLEILRDRCQVNVLPA